MPAWNLSGATYNGEQYDPTSQDVNPRDTVFKADGTKMYIIGATNETVYAYDLSTPWDVSTATYNSESFSVASQEAFPISIYFKTDGTKMYAVGSGNDTVYAYDLSTAWDVSTASYNSENFSVNTQAPNPSSVRFKEDGAKMYVLSGGNQDIFAYDLSTAWDVSSASYNSENFDPGTQLSNPSSIAFETDGTKMYAVGSGNDTVYAYDLSTPWDVSSATYNSESFSVAGQEIGPQGLTFRSNGAKMYVTGFGYDGVTAYDLVPPITFKTIIATF